MDDLDRKLLSLLAVDGRASVTTLAARLGVARTTVQTRLERLERDKVITGYTVRLGDETRRNRIRATVLVSCDARAAPQLLQRLKRMPEVAQAVTASGRFDYIVTLVAQNTTDLDRALDEIGDIAGVHSSESLIHLSAKIDRAV